MIKVKARAIFDKIASPHSFGFASCVDYFVFSCEHNYRVGHNFGNRFSHYRSSASRNLRDKLRKNRNKWAVKDLLKFFLLKKNLLNLKKL